MTITNHLFVPKIQSDMRRACLDHLRVPCPKLFVCLCGSRPSSSKHGPGTADKPLRISVLPREIVVLSALRGFPFHQLADGMLLRKYNPDHVTNNPVHCPREMLLRFAAPSIPPSDAQSKLMAQRKNLHLHACS
jgi:hypothetical protein